MGCRRPPPARRGRQRPSALMRPPHHLHGIFEMSPLLGFLGIALALASNRILRRLGDSLGTVLLKHLPRNRVNLHLGDHVALPYVRSFGAAGTGSSTMLRLL